MPEDIETTGPNRPTVGPARDPEVSAVADQAATALLTGLAVCGFCGQPVESAFLSPGQVAYRCGAEGERPHLLRNSATVDVWIRLLVLERLARDDAGHLVAESSGPDLYELRAHSGGLRARRSQLAEPEAGEIAVHLDRELAAVEERMVEHVARDLPASLTGADPLEGAWDRLSPDQQRTVLRRIIERTALHPVPPGRRAGDRDVLRSTVLVTWRTP
jgi:hypothetical protein